LLHHSIANQISGAMVAATDAVTKDYAEGDVGDEDDFSSQLCGRLKSKLNDAQFQPSESKLASDLSKAGEQELRPSRIRLRARHLTWRGKRGEEGVIGADIVLVLDVDIPAYHITKGLLIQAKRLERGKRFASSDAATLTKQCNDMLTVSPASFVFLYSKTAVTPVSATALWSNDAVSPYSLPTYPLGWLYNDFAICWVGDRRIKATDGASLRRLLQRRRARNGLLISASGADDDADE
jgi:hypothetical protein